MAKFSDCTTFAPKSTFLDLSKEKGLSAMR